VADHPDAVLLERLATARPWPRARHDRAVSLWESYVDPNPLPFVCSCVQGKPTLAGILEKHGAFIRRTLAHLGVRGCDLEDVAQEVRQGVARGLAAFDPSLSRTRRRPCEGGCLASVSVRRPVTCATYPSGARSSTRIRSSTGRAPGSVSRTCSARRSGSPCSNIFFRVWTPRAVPSWLPMSSMACAWTMSPRLSAFRSIRPGTGCASAGQTCARPGSGWPTRGEEPAHPVGGDMRPSVKLAQSEGRPAGWTPYQIGCVFFEMLTRGLPYEACNDPEASAEAGGPGGTGDAGGTGGARDEPSRGAGVLTKGPPRPPIGSLVREGARSAEPGPGSVPEARCGRSEGFHRSPSGEPCVLVAALSAGERRSSGM